MDDIALKTTEAANFLKTRTVPGAYVGIILGSGLGGLADRVEDRTSIQYSRIPGFPGTTVPGHEGNLVSGTLGGAKILIMQGRAHYYEGHPIDRVAFPVRVLHALGVKTLITTNAAGGISGALGTGDFMLVTDHINLMGVNPLRGQQALAPCPSPAPPPGLPTHASRGYPGHPPPQVGRGEGISHIFVDMTGAYDPGLRKAALDAADAEGITLKEGVLAALPGPSYETPAEVRMLKTLGADAVSMSMVPEVIVARYLGMRVLGLSLITNTAAGLSAEGPDHAEVIETARRRTGDFARLVESIVRQI